MRIWHQGFVDFGKTPIYRKSFETHLAAVLDPGIDVTIHGMRPGTFGETMTPIDALRYPYLESLLQAQICEAALTAERSGYDALAINCFYDPGLREARSLIDIPVVSLFESCFLTALSLGRSVGMLALNEDQCDKHRDLVRAYGFADRFAGTLPVTPPIDEYMLEGDASTSAPIADGITSACRALSARGADIIIPGDGVLNDFIWRSGIGFADAPLMDAAAVLIRHAVYLVGLREKIGLAKSPRFFTRPPADMLAASRAFHGSVAVEEGSFSGVGPVSRSPG